MRGVWIEVVWGSMKRGAVEFGRIDFLSPDVRPMLTGKFVSFHHRVSRSSLVRDFSNPKAPELSFCVRALRSFPFTAFMMDDGRLGSFPLAAALESHASRDGLRKGLHASLSGEGCSPSFANCNQDAVEGARTTL